MPHSDRLFSARLAVSVTKRELFWRLLKSEHPSVTTKKTDAFTVGLTELAEQFRAELRENTGYRDAHEALRDIFQLIADPKGSVARIRLKLQSLPQAASDEVIRRAKRRYPDLCGADEITWARFLNWAETCDEPELLEKTQFLIATGRARSLGQERDDGSRSAFHIEPLIVGQHRRLHHPELEGLSAPTKPKGGRPSLEAVDNFLRRLGLLWLEATGQAPRAGKGARTPFVRMARLVLHCVGVKARDAALKRFWAAMRHHSDRPSNIPADF